MSLAVVRCPACLGASQVAPDAVGQMVACPRCEVPFVAAEDVPVVQPTRPRGSAAPRPAAAIPVSPPRRPRALVLSPVEDAGPPPELPSIPDPEHDPHLPPPAGLPVSVLIGLALLPLGIPLFWWITPVVTGQAAALSLAVPISLAFAASTLCLGVVYTIDWTATTRIKGVLMLVGLAYMSAAGLFFLKKELVERIRAWGGEKIHWRYADSKEWKVLMPGAAEGTEEQPLMPAVHMTIRQRATYKSDLEDDEYGYLVATGPVGDEVKANDKWFDSIGQELMKKHGDGELIGSPHSVTVRDYPGREWQFKKGDKYCFIRVFLVQHRVYYLSAEGPRLKAEDELAFRFFNSFEPKPK